MGKAGRKKANPAHIAQLEHEIADLNRVIPTLDEEIADAHDAALKARQNREWTGKKGVVLDAEAIKRAAERVDAYPTYAASAAAFAPGAVWVVDDPRSVQLYKRNIESALFYGQ